MKSAVDCLRTTALVAAIVGSGVACTEAPPCTEEQAENGDTEDCSDTVDLVTYIADSDESVTLRQPWSSGDSLHLEGAIREVTVVEGSADDEVEITYRAAADLADGRSEAFVLDTFEQLDVEFRARGETLRLAAAHPSTSVELGAALVVALPLEFDGEFLIQKFGAPGNVTIEYLGQATSLDVDMEAPDSDLLVEDTGEVRLARLNVAGSVETVAFTNEDLEQVVINSEEGDIVTGFDVVPRSHATLLTGKIKDDSIKDTGGNINVRLPEDGNFTAATYTKDQARFEGTSGCDRTEIARDIQKLVCGSGDVDGKLTFQLTSSGNITVQVR
jgi:hypothetical protein